MTIEVSFNRYQHDWYVGEIYHLFHEHLVSKYGDDVIYTPISELSQRFDNCDISSSTSIFSIYNLIVTNKETNKTFIHSLSDYAPAMMDDSSGILNFDVVAFSCTSNLTEDIISRYSTKYNIIPSFYILENLSDVQRIEDNRYYPDRLNNIYFNGLCYGERDAYRNLLSTNELFLFKNKSNPTDYLNKTSYFNEITKYKFGLSLNGAAKICYRDLEYFGLGILCLREPLIIKTNDPLIDGVHYITLLDDDIRSKLYNSSEHNYIMEKITDKINYINSNDDYIDIINNARKWYENNCLPINQIKQLESFLNDCGIIQ